MKCLHTKYQNLYQKMLHSSYPHSINETEEGDAKLEIIYPRSEGSRKLVPTNVNETFPLCLIHPIPLYVPRLFHHRCFLILVGRLHSSSRLDVARRHLAILLSLHTARYAWDTKEGIISVYEMFPRYMALYTILFFGINKSLSTSSRERSPRFFSKYFVLIISLFSENFINCAFLLN